MGELERFLNSDDPGLPTLVKAGLAHVQFETIHPFLDGNGRTGSLLITLLLIHAGVLQQPLLYLSLFLKQHRQEYYRLLDHVRQTADWEAWLAFFLEGVQITMEGALSTAQRLNRTFRDDYERIATGAGRRASSALRVHQALTARVVVSLGEATNQTGLTFPTVLRAMNFLVEHGIAEELTGRSRNRLYSYRDTLLSSTRESKRRVDVAGDLLQALVGNRQVLDQITVAPPTACAGASAAGPAERTAGRSASRLPFGVVRHLATGSAADSRSRPGPWAD